MKKKIGQLLVVGYQGAKPVPEFYEFVEEWGIGGIIFFVRNINDPADIFPIINRLKTLAKTEIFTCIDQEGGLVLRILTGGSLFPGAMAISAGNSLEQASKIGEAIGKEMRALGLNWNLAPVLDINHPDNPGIGARAFGDTPDRVADFGNAMIKGFRKGGILSCAKHFPGKGHAKVDSHLSLPIIPYDCNRLREFELYPFREAIKIGVDAIMTAHVFFPAFEPEKGIPGTLSKSVLTNLLRHELGFEGLLITDDLEMGAITDAFGVSEAARLAFLAGSDLMLICHDLERQRATAELLYAEVEKNPGAKTRLDESLRRVKKARLKLANPATGKDLSTLALEHESLVFNASKNGILAHKIEAGHLPVSSDDSMNLLFPELSALVQVEESHIGSGLGQLFKDEFPQARLMKYHPKASAAEITQIFDSCATPEIAHRLVVVLSYNSHLFPGQKEAFSKLTKENHRLIMVALRNPYDLTAVSGVKTGLATFGFRTPTIKALIDILLGRSPVNHEPWPVNLGAVKQ